MATAAVGTSVGISYAAETTFGVIPTSPTMKALRLKSGAKFDLKRDTFQSKELNTSRQVMGMTYGNRSGSAELPIEFSYGSFDDLMEACLGGTWATNVLKCGNVKRSFSMEQQWPDINLNEQNTGVVITGFSLNVKPNAVVEGNFTALFKDQACVHYADDGVTTMAFAATTITRSAGSFITDGFAVGDTVTVTGASVAGNNKNIVITTLTATVMTASAAGFTVDTAKTGVTLAKTLGTPVAANTNPVFDSFTGTLLVDGVATAIVTGIELKIDQSGQANNVLFDATAASVTLSTINVTGSVVVRFINNNLKKKYLSGTAVDLSFTLGNGSSKSYKFDMSNTKFTGANTDTGENELTQTLAYQAIYDGTDASTVMITRYP